MPSHLKPKTLERIEKGEILLVFCDEAQFSAYRHNFFLLWDRVTSEYSNDAIQKSKLILIYSEEVQAKRLIYRTREVCNRALAILNRIKKMQPVQSLILPQFPSDFREQHDWYSALLKDKRPIALINSATNKKIMVSQGYCSMTGKSQMQWLMDEHTKGRWSQSDFMSMEDYLERDGFISQHSYKAIHCQTPGKMKDWTTSFQLWVDPISGMRCRLSLVEFVDGVYDSAALNQG